MIDLGRGAGAFRIVPPRAARPFVKWAGGKTRLLAELMKHVPRTYARYFEPFAGGAALFFALAPERAVLADLNVDLIRAYRAVCGDVETLIRNLRRHACLHGRKHYYETRDRWNKGCFSSETTRAAAFIYLNKTCFNGLWRVNRSGHFNVPIGRYTDPPICEAEALRAARTVLSQVLLRCVDYRAAVADAERGDLIYFDPPYDPVTQTANFRSYTAEGFTAKNQRELAATVRALDERGCFVMLSNSDTPFVRSLYRGFKVERVAAARSIAARAGSRANVNELLIRCWR